MAPKATALSPSADNASQLLHDDAFWNAIRHHGILLLALPLITIAIALFFAFVLNVGGGSRHGVMAGVWGSGFYPVVFLLPQVLAIAILGVLFQMVYRPDASGNQWSAETARSGTRPAPGSRRSSCP